MTESSSTTANEARPRTTRQALALLDVQSQALREGRWRKHTAMLCRGEWSAPVFLALLGGAWSALIPFENRWVVIGIVMFSLIVVGMLQVQFRSARRLIEQLRQDLEELKRKQQISRRVPPALDSAPDQVNGTGPS